MNIRKHFLLSILVAFSLFVRAQDRVADSLLKVITSLPVDTPRVNKLNDLSWHFRGSSPKETMKYGLEAKAMAEKIHYLKGLARAYKNIGISHYFESKYVEALQSWTTAMELYDSTSDKTGVANMLNNIGSVFYSQGSEIKALDYFLKSLRISEELNDTLRIASSLGSIANVYLEKKQTHDKALVYFYKALPLAIAIRDSNIIGSATVGIGEIYLRKCEAEPLLVEKGYLDTALFYFNKSLNAYTGTEAVIYSLNDIGKVFLLKEDYAKAVEYHNRAYALAGEKGNKLYMSQSLLGLGNAYAKQENYKAALTSFKQAERISADNETKYELKKAYEGLAANYSKLSDYINAFRYQVLLTTIKDSIYSIESDKKLGSLQFDFDIQKKQGEINLLTKDKEIQEQVIQRQRLVRNGFIGGFAVMVLFASIFFRQRNRISKEKKRSDELLLNILPEETAEELKLTGTARAKSFDQVTVMFTDFKNFTQASELLSPEELVHEINHCYSEFDKIITRHGIEKIKTIGDAYMCAGGLPVVNETHAFDVIHAGLEFQKFIAENKKIREAQNQPYFELRLGIHTGPVVAGIVGIKKFAYDIWGDTVNTASRMESSGEIGKVNISGVTYELVKDKFHCHYRGKVQAKNKGEIDMYFVEAPLA